MAGEVTTENDLNLGGMPTGNSGGVQNFFQSILADPQKRLIAIIVAVLLVILLAVGGMVISKKAEAGENQGNLVALVEQLDQARAFEIVAKLKSVNIDAKVNPSEKPGEYTVSVYEKAVENAYLTLARTNLLEDEDYGLFDQNDWAASDYDKRIKLSRAVNGDLSRIISRMDGLKSAIVRVNVPEQELFSELQSPTTATVQVELLNDGEELSKTQVKSIVNILRGYVPNLEKERISIVDTQGRNYSAYKEDDESDTDDYIEEVEKINKLIKKRISGYLDTVVGAKLYEVSVSASVSREKVEEQQTKYSEGAVGSRQLDQETLRAGAAGNAAAAGPSAGGNSKDYNSQSVNETLLPSYEQRSTTYLPGRVTKVTVALAVDTSVPTMVSLNQLRDSVAAIIGPEATSEDVKLTVIDLESRRAGAISGNKSKPGFAQMVTKFFQGGIWSVIMKVFTIIAIVIGLLIAAVFGLNFLNAASNRNINEEIDPNLGAEFDQVLNEPEPAPTDDYGESAVLAQQEALLKEMMGDSSAKVEGMKTAPTSYETPSNQEDNDKMQFDNLLSNFQSVANSKPDLLAKKIQVWLDE